MNITLMLIIALVIFALIGLSVLFKRRDQHAARSLSESATQRVADSMYEPARYFNQQSKNPQIVNPQKTDEEKE